MRIVHTFEPEKEVWHYISKFLSQHYAENFLSRRIQKNFYEFRFDKIVEAKKELGNDVEICKPINKESIEDHAKEITLTVRQAIELYKASKELSLHAKPILLYYSFAKLGRVLFLSTYKDSSNFERNHGLTMDTNNGLVKFMKKGFFARFHDCYNMSPAIYLEEYAFSWDDLLKGAVERYDLFENIRSNKPFEISTTKGKTIALDEMTREFIFSYAICMLARYNVVSWSKVLEGKQSDMVWNLETYVDNIQMFLPNLILNTLLGEQYLFFPESRVGA